MNRIVVNLSDWIRLLVYGKNAPKAGQLIYVDPSNVKYYCNRFRERDSGRIVDGDWDLDLTVLDSRPKVELIRKKIRSGCSWEDAGLISKAREKLDVNRTADGCRTLPELIQRYERLDLLLDHLRNGGRFLSRAELGGYREFGGIMIHLNRHGDPVFGARGCHRLIMAQELGLRKIPAMLGVLHLSAYKKGLVSGYLGPEA